MKLSRITIENFRNYSKYTHNFAPDKDFTIFAGPNGIGKTNFLEAVYVLSLGRSFRSIHRDDLVEWEKPYTRCKAFIDSDAGKTELEFFYSTSPARIKNFKKNGVSLKNSEYFGNLLTVLFQPEDINMIYQTPCLRRRYIDIVLCQTDKKYLRSLAGYKKVLRQRNALLKEIFKMERGGQNVDHLKEDLQVWDEEMTPFGMEIIGKRLDFVDFLNQKLPALYNEISGSGEKITVLYLSKIAGKNYLDELFNRRSRDIQRVGTTAGPHRDDLVFYLNEKEIAHFGSRGEARTLLLALKLAEIRYIEEKTGQKPVLLLDDVFSELDRKRQQHLLGAIRGCQTIMTATDASSIEKIATDSEFAAIARR